ncbi:MAG: hypothetical protein M3409_08830 [Gemmatimonadota bacterium]|jgi:hypothetical protein|nr:hypothetical protein [Gemmatimonadota bacterium]
MTMTTMTLEVVGVRTLPGEGDKEKKGRRVQVELRALPSEAETGLVLPMMGPLQQQTIEVDRKDQPELGARVTVTYEVAR